jgi:hypothetical protein
MQEADMAVAPLTVNYQRAEVVDFTKPFLSLGISILFRIPDDHTPNLFSFLNPLSKEIWLWIMMAAISVTLSMFVIGEWPKGAVRPITVQPGSHRTNGIRQWRSTWISHR